MVMSRKYSLIILPILVAFLVLASVPASEAAEAGPFYVGVFGGYVIPDYLELSNGGKIDYNLKDSWMLGAKFGYIIPAFKWVAAEVEYNHSFKQDIDEKWASGDFSTDNVMANLLVRSPEGKFHPYVGFGIGWSRGQFKVSNPGVESIDKSDNAFAWQALAGLNFEITPNWSADVGYRFFQSKYSVENVDAKSRNQIILIGVNYHF
jgi:opacity protein-like surface antigen